MSAFGLDGKVALVTGAASGIGAATARVFAEAGADIAAGWYPGDPHDVEPTRQAVEAAGRRCIAVEVDVSDTASVEALVARTVGELGGDERAYD
jgi:3-oxoacyl-[acyl-carrier protein] reductase